MINFLENNWKWLVPVTVVVIVGIILAIIFIPKYTGPSENCYFINEPMNLHSEYTITVEDINEYDQIDILLNENDTEKITQYSNSTHFLGVTLTINRVNTIDPKEDHIFDSNDFKLKDHTGFKFSNIYFLGKSGLALSEKDFSTTNAIEDYSYIGQSVLPGEEKTFVIYFEISEDISAYNDITVLEVDFFATSIGSDIVLAERSTNE